MSQSVIESQDEQQQRIVLLLSYYGPDFSGSQKQDNAYSVQEALDDALNHLHIPHGALNFAGRTDAGVHAKGQTCHFDVPLGALDRFPNLPHTLNAVLPKGISIRDMAITDDFRFHVTTKANYRWYQYRIYNAPLRSVWMPQDAVWLYNPLNVELMHQGAQKFLGEHDFESLKCARSSIPNTVCNVIHSSVSADGEYIVFNVVANRFIYKLVRNMMGVLINIGQEKDFTPDDIPLLLARRDRQSAGPTAPPNGLSLMAVDYPENWDFFQNDVYVTSLKRILQESREHHEQNLLCKAS